MLAVRLMQLFSENKSDFSKLSGLLGLYFQVNDDYINLNSKDVCLLLHGFYYKRIFNIFVSFI